MSQATTDPSSGAVADPEFFAVGFGSYQNFPHLDIEPEIERIARQFEAFGVRRSIDWDAPMDTRDWPAVEKRLESWVSSGATGSILYWVGHGLSNQEFSGLAYASSPNDVKNQKGLVTPGDLARFIKRRDEDEADADHWALILIDACQSARFIEQLNVALDNDGGPRRVLLLASSPPNAVATLGRLGKAVEDALRSFLNVPEVSLVRLAQEIKIKLESIGAWIPKEVVHVILHNRRALPESLRTTLDNASALVGYMEAMPETDRTILQSELAAAELGEAAFHFSGRATELAMMGTWLASSVPMLVVTGAPGSGKSALLGHLLLRSNPVVWNALRPTLGASAGPDLSAGPKIDAAVRLTGVTTKGLITALAAHLGLGAPSDAEAEEQTAWLMANLAGRARSIVLADGLDEAADVFGVVGLMSRLASSGQLRFVVGTRRSISSEWGIEEPDRADIIERLVNDIGSEVLYLERDPDALSAYVRLRLEAAATAGVVGLRPRIPRAVEQLRGAPDFLSARLAVLELIARPSLVDEGWLIAVVNEGPAAIFRQALRRLDALNPRFRPLLMALAERRGRGMPSETLIWLAAAQGIAAGGPMPQAADLDELLSDAGAPYLLVDNEFDSTAYRLAHRVFVDVLREEV